jgi:hypothetical protein
MLGMKEIAHPYRDKVHLRIVLSKQERVALEAQARRGGRAIQRRRRSPLWGAPSSVRNLRH